MRGRAKWPKHLEQNNDFRQGVAMTWHLSGASMDNINLIDMGMVRGIIKGENQKSPESRNPAIQHATCA